MRNNPRRAVTGGLVVAALFIAGLSIEALVIGPRFGTTDVEGTLMPSTIGFNAPPQALGGFPGQH